MAVVSEKVYDVVRRGLETARLDPSVYAVRVRLVGGKTQTQFTDEQAPTDHVVEANGVRLFIDEAITGKEFSISVSDEHDQIVVTTG